MPFKSDKQMRWMYANKPEMAREWSDKYAMGGGILQNMKDKDVAITIKEDNGNTITVKSPTGNAMDMSGILGGYVNGKSPTPVADDKTIRVTSGEYVVNQPATAKYGGLLEMINNEGREMLQAQGYANGGVIGSNPTLQSQQATQVQPKPQVVNSTRVGGVDFHQLSNGSWVNNQGVAVPAPTQAGNPVTQQPGVQQIATDIAEQAQPEQVSGQIDIGGKTITPGEKGTIQKFSSIPVANDLQEAVDTAEDKPSLLDNIQASIDKSESKHQALQKLVFGASLLSGSGFDGAIANMSNLPNFNQQELDQLYEQKDAIMDRLRGNVEVGDQAFRGTDGKLYFQGTGNQWVDSNNQPKPDDVDLKGKASTEDEGDLPAKLQTQVNTADESLNNAYGQKAQIVNVLRHIPGNADFWSGRLFGGTRRAWKDLFGTQEELDTWRTQVRNLITSEAIGNLPPGVASDKDIELVLSAQPNANVNPEQLTKFLAASQRLINYNIRYNEAKRDYIYDNRSTRGFKPPKYDPSGVDEATIGVTNETEILDLT